MLEDNYEQRKRLLLQAVRLIGGEEVLADLLEVDQSTVSRWINSHKRKMCYDTALLIEECVGIPVELLRPDSKANRYLRENYVLTKLVLRPVMKKQIIIPESFSEPYLGVARPIIIGTDGVLISGLETFKIQPPSRTGHLRVAVLDLEALWSERYSLEYIKLLYTECFAISRRIEQLLVKNQGQRNDLRRSQPTSKEIFELCLSCDEVEERKDEKLARVSGFTSKDAYHRVKKICCHGIPELIKALTDCELAVSAAAQLARLPKAEQKAALESKAKSRPQRKSSRAVFRKPKNLRLTQKEKVYES